MRELDDIFAGLARSAFRRRLKLRPAERAYLQAKGLAAILEHARGFIDRRLAPAHPPNDGKQTPFRGHPVFVAQHATATCCRGCLAKWHGIARGHPLDAAQQQHILSALERWLEANAGEAESQREDQGRLL